MSESSPPVALPTTWKNGIFQVVDRIARGPRGQRFLSKIVEVAQTGLGAGSHDDEGERTGENRLISAMCATLGDVVALDVGANNGSWTLEMRARCPGARVISVEPGSQASGTLVSRVGEDSRVRVVRAAIGAEDGSATLYGIDQSGLQASLRPQLLQRTTYTDTERDMPSEVVPLITVSTLIAESLADGFLAEGRLVNVMKIDTEGFELDILQLVLASPLRENMAAIQFEFHMHALAQGHLIGDFAGVFGDEFRLFRLAPQKLIPLEELGSVLANYYGFSNWVAVRRDLADRMVAAYAQADPRMRRRLEWRN